MVAFSLLMTRRAGRKHPNRAALLWSLGSSLMAFFGAYVMLNLAMMAYAVPELLGRSGYRQRLPVASFWMMCGAMSVMTFALTFAGFKQVELQRFAGESCMDTQDQLALFYWVRLGSGVFVLIAALLFLPAHFLPQKAAALAPKPVAAK